VEGAEETAVLSSNVLSDTSLISTDPWLSLEDLLRLFLPNHRNSKSINIRFDKIMLYRIQLQLQLER